ncbi:MAG TPA: hypothetical protein VI299_29835 [Polyangiales bacterium]
MVASSTVTCVLLACVLLGLWAKDLSPRTALYKLVRRIFAVDLAPPRPLTDGPFATSSAPAHRPLLLSLQTYEGSGQAVHPDVAFIPEGFGAGRWRYWMALTPYPHARERYENPSVFASHDGLNWVVPCQNPIVAAPTSPRDHLSDVDLLFVDGRLRLYFRESVYTREPPEHRIHVMESADGVQWTPPRLVLRSTRLLLSPSVVRDGDGFVMWEVSENTIWRRESTDGFAWSDPEPTRVSGLVTGQEPWHLDVTVASDKLHLLLNSVGVDGHRLHYGCSRDGGRTWTVHPYLLERAYGFETAQHYRATMVPHPSDRRIHQMWYSARSEAMVWSIAYLHLEERADGMVPCSIVPGVSKALTGERA